MGQCAVLQGPGGEITALGLFLFQTLGLGGISLRRLEIVVIPAWIQVYLEVKNTFFPVALYYQQPGEMQGLGPLEIPRC